MKIKKSDIGKSCMVRLEEDFSLQEAILIGNYSGIYKVYVFDDRTVYDIEPNELITLGNRVIPNWDTMKKELLEENKKILLSDTSIPEKYQTGFYINSSPITQYTKDELNIIVAASRKRERNDCIY